MKVDHVGDFILSFDALIALRSAFPHARLELLCATWNETLARSLDIFDAVHTMQFFAVRADGEHPGDRHALLADLPTGQYDLAIDLRVDADTRMLLRHIAAIYRVGFESETENDCLTLCMPHYLPAQTSQNVAMHQSLLMLRLVRSAADLFNRHDAVRQLLLGRVAEPPAIDLSMARNRMLVVCNTGSGRAVKNWPADRFRRLVRWLAVDLDAIVLLVGGKDQSGEAEAIMQACGSPNVISAAGRTTIRQAVSIVAQASVFIGNDSGLTHVAGRLGIPTIVLMSGIDPTVMWAAVGEQVTILRAPVPCSPCHIAHMRDCVNNHACMLNLSEQSVRAAARSALLTATPYGQPESRGRPADLRAGAPSPGRVALPSQQRPRLGLDRRHPDAQAGQLRLEQLRHAFLDGNPQSRGDFSLFHTLVGIFDRILKEKLYGDIAEVSGDHGDMSPLFAAFAGQLGAAVHVVATPEGAVPRDGARLGGLVPAEARFCLVRIGSGHHHAVVEALAFFYDRLLPGGFLIIHDDGSTGSGGAAPAADAFFADRLESLLPIAGASGTAVVRKAKAVQPLKSKEGLLF